MKDSIINIDSDLISIIEAINSSPAGIAFLVNSDGKFHSVFTDGDLRRAFKNGVDLNNVTIGEISLKNCITTQADELAVNVVNMMQDKKITILPVVDGSNKVEGIIHMHDLLKAGIV